jgi:hypothetical protein
MTSSSGSIVGIVVGRFLVLWALAHDLLFMGGLLPLICS